MNPKYVIIKNDNGIYVRIVASYEEHKDVVSKNDSVVSAGFFTLFVNGTDIDIKCYGKSVSLEVESNPKKDSQRLRRFFDLAR